MESSKCPKCGDDPHFIAHVDKWYCFGCNSYIGEEEEATAVGHVEEEVASVQLEIPVPRSPSPVGSEPLECKSCGAELQDLKDGRLYCFMCETYQDEIKEEHERVENEAQALVDQASVSASSVTPVTLPIPVAVPANPAPESKPVDASPAPATTVPTPEFSPPVISESSAILEPPAPPPDKPAFVRMCLSCGQPLKYIDKYQRYYCYGCKKYASKDDKLKGTPEKKKCPDCGGELRFIEKYNEHYCNSCKKYPLRARNKVATVKAEVLSCPKCSTPLKWVEKYSRHYCYTCKEYSPKGYSGGSQSSTTEKKVCPGCHESMKYVAEYDEWYCYKCRKYSLRPNKPAMFL
jgi:ribosomal protein S27AE/predicted RNA-binding Zn-ribbon protein involved in translation (DUF1610 family)